MVEFGTGRYHPMDREYGASSVADNSTSDIGVGIKDVGMSVPLGIAAPNVQGMAAKIRTGARAFELGFPGAGRSQRGAQTPGVYGKLQRQALEELSRANEINFTTHSAYNIMGLAGMDQQGNFSKASKKFGIDEIKRAIEFASDVARGGSVVVHTGEFQRPLSDADWNQTGGWKDKFRSYKEEPEEAAFFVVDDRTGRLIEQARKNRGVPRPVWNVAKSGQEYYEGGVKKTAREGEKVYLDYEDNMIDPQDRVPEYDTKEGIFKSRLMEWDDFKEESQEMTQRARRFWKENQGKSGEQWRESPWYRFRNVKSADEILVKPEEAYIIGTLETNASNARGWSYYYGQSFEEDKGQLKKLREAKEFYEKLQKATSEEERWKLKREVGSSLRHMVGDLVPPDAKYPVEIIDGAIKDVQNKVRWAKEASASQWLQAQENMETMRHVESAETYALRESYDSYAQAGMKAMAESDKLDKKGLLKKPLFISMENIFPESYGGHPDELIELVKGARNQMSKMLVDKGYSENQANQEAKEHIKTTFDTGHMNMWKKYFKGSDGEFNNWYLEKVEKMAKEGIIGNVHLTDNYGYQDDHLSPGQGNCPVVETVRILKKHGYEGPLTVEPGADASTDLSDFHGLMKTWKLFGSSVYGVGEGGRATPTRDRRWGDVQYSYFGQAEPPYFVFGGYSPSEDWTLWSGTPME